MLANDIAAILSGLTGLAASSGITYWMYRTLNKTIDNLKEEVKNLKSEVKELKEDRYKWYHKSVKLGIILSKTSHCFNADKCAVKAEYEKYIEEEGII